VAAVAVSAVLLGVPGLTAPVEVSFSKEGLASVSARNTHDLFPALAALQALAGAWLARALLPRRRANE
jgi:acyl-homoserine lactone acylase PvdQ